MAVLLLDLVIARPQLHCKQRVLFDCTSKDAGLECCIICIGNHKPNATLFVAMRPCKVHKGKGVM